MNTFKKLFCIILAIALCFAALTVNAHARGERFGISSANEHNSNVNSLSAYLERKYNITITYPVFQSGRSLIAGIFPETLEALDLALSYLTPQMVRAISAHYAEINGTRLTIAYSFHDMPSGADGLNSIVTVGWFDQSQGTISLKIPYPGRGAIVTGDTPMTIVHEMGHALHMMLERNYDMTYIRERWMALNGQYIYNIENMLLRPDLNTFASAYAATSFYEDFAETFAYGFVSNKPGMGLRERAFDSNGNLTNFGRKLELMDAILVRQFPNYTRMHDNFRRSKQVSSSIIYNGGAFSGRHLQFTGYPEPRYFPVVFLDEFPHIPEREFVWRSGIGGWVAQWEGAQVIVFPDLFYQVRRI